MRAEHYRHSKRVTSTRRWQTLRMAILERDGFCCRTCGAKGRLEVDHILPVRTRPDLSYEPRNLQALCPACHTRKTRIECGRPAASADRQDWAAAVASLAKDRAPAFSIPFDLRPSGVPVTLIVGPPCAGKTTYARAHAGADDLIIDLDDNLRAAGGRPWDTDRAILRAAFKAHDAAIRGLADRRRGRAWLIKIAPTLAERRAWAKALDRVRVMVLETPAATCKARLATDLERAHAAPRIEAAIDQWWSTHAAERGAEGEGHA